MSGFVYPNENEQIIRFSDVAQTSRPTGIMTLVDATVSLVPGSDPIDFPESPGSWVYELDIAVDMGAAIEKSVAGFNISFYKLNSYDKKSWKIESDDFLLYR